MSGFAHAVADRKVILAADLPIIGRKAAFPAQLCEIGRLPDPVRRFAAADRHQNRADRSWQVGNQAVARSFIRCQADLRIHLQHRYRLQLIDAGDRHHALHDVGGAAFPCPVAGQHHRRQMRAGGMAGQVEPVRIAADLPCVGVQPAHRVRGLADNAADGQGWRQIVVQHRHRGAGGDQRFGDVAVEVLVQPAPVTAMDEDMNRCVRCLRRKDIYRLQGAVAIAHVQRAGQLVPGLCAAAGLGVEIGLEVRRGEARVVFPLQRLAGEPFIACSHQPLYPTTS